MTSTREVLNEGWSYRRKANVFQELRAADPWRDVTLPHDALLDTPRAADAARGECNAYYGGGAFEYRRILPVGSELTGLPVYLEFDGVYRDPVVHVNGAFAGQHRYGYSRFHVRIDPFLKPGTDNDIRVSCRTILDSRWYAGAGIHRDVHLVVKTPVHIGLDGVEARTAQLTADEATLEVSVQVVNAGAVTATPRVRAVLTAAGAEVDADAAPVTVFPGEPGTARFRLRVSDPHPWSADDPYLYDLRVELTDGDELLDAYETPVGLRTLSADTTHGLRVNGVPTLLRGACIHADNGPLGTAAIARAEERKVELLKAAGFNAIRSAHHPASSALLAACDRLGMYVMDEGFDMWTVAKTDFDYSADFPEFWERDAEAMVAKDRNHPSVILYSIGNEIPETGSPSGGVWSRRLAEKLRALDPTRLVTNGVNGFVSVIDTLITAMQARGAAPEQGGVNQMMSQMDDMMSKLQSSPMVTERTEESFAVLDVAGMNYGDIRYATDAGLFPHRVIVGAETYPSAIDRTWGLVTSLPHVIGDFTWTGLDYLGEVGIGYTAYVGDALGSGFSTPYPGLTAWCGDIDLIGQRRPASYYRETVFGLRTAPYLAVQPPARHDTEVAVATPWSWSDTVGSWSWPGFEGKPVRVEVYADADEVELLLGGSSLGRAAVGATRTYRADFDITYEPGELTAVAYRDGAEVGRGSLVSAGDDVLLTASVDRAEIAATPGDLAYVDIAFTDSHGVVHTTLDRPVTVTVAGPGTLAALGSANPITDEGFAGPERRTFQGRALAIVRPTGAGTVTVTVEAEGCDPVTVEVAAA